MNVARHGMVASLGSKDGQAFSATRLYFWTAPCKGATEWYIVATRDFAGDPHDLVSLVRVGNQNAGHQRLGIGVDRCGAPREDLDHAAEVHHQGAIAEILHQRQVMGNEHVGEIESIAQILQ